jgi:hypothetical protein
VDRRVSICKQMANIAETAGLFVRKGGCVCWGPVRVQTINAIVTVSVAPSKRMWHIVADVAALAGVANNARLGLVSVHVPPKHPISAGHLVSICGRTRHSVEAVRLLASPTNLVLLASVFVHHFRRCAMALASTLRPHRRTVAHVEKLVQTGLFVQVDSVSRAVQKAHRQCVWVDVWMCKPTACTVAGVERPVGQVNCVTMAFVSAHLTGSSVTDVASTPNEIANTVAVAKTVVAMANGVLAGYVSCPVLLAHRPFVLVDA